MKKLYFTPKELSIVKASVDARKKIWLGQSNLIADLDDILSRIGSPFLTLKQIQKARLIGCVKNHILDPNNHLYLLTDYTISTNYKEYKSLMLKMDIGSSTINKLSRHKDKKIRLFKDKIKQLELLYSVKDICYSESCGNIYKIGLVASNGLIFRTELDSDAIGRIKFEKINKDLFMKTGRIDEIMEKLEDLESCGQLIQAQLKMKEILLMILKSQA